MLFAQDDSFIPSFPICRPVFFFCLIALAWTYSTKLKRSRDILILFLILVGKFFVSTIKCDISFKVEKTMGTHSSTVAWKIPWTEEPGRLQSIGSLRVRHDWASSLSLFTFMHWRRKWQSTPVFLPGKSQGWGRLVGCCLWGRTESDTTEAT